MSNQTLKDMVQSCTLKDMLQAAKYSDNQGDTIGFKLQECLEKAIRRAAQVVEGCDRESARWRVADSILKDAGLE